GLLPLRLRAKAVTSHLMPTFARVHLAFERGEGVWLYATDGERYLDFTSGVAVNALGHAHPHLVEALKSQAEKLWHVSNLYDIPEDERAAERLCAASFADVVFFSIPGRKPANVRSRPPASIKRRADGRSAIASSPSKVRFTAARWQRSPPAVRRNISTGSGRSSTASTRCRSAISPRPSARSARRPRRS